jgi:hypothetical protein
MSAASKVMSAASKHVRSEIIRYAAASHMLQLYLHTHSTHSTRNRESMEIYEKTCNTYIIVRYTWKWNRNREQHYIYIYNVYTIYIYMYININIYTYIYLEVKDEAGVTRACAIPSELSWYPSL